MMAVKLIGMILILLSSMLIGAAAGERAKSRIRLLESLRRLLVILRGELKYSIPVLSELLLYISEYGEDVWKDYFHDIGEMLERGDYSGNIDDIWCEYACAGHIDRLLYEEDYNSLVRFGRDMTDMDIDTLINRVDMYIRDLDRRISSLNSDIANRVRLCRMLGAAGGVFMIILIS